MLNKIYDFFYKKNLIRQRSHLISETIILISLNDKNKSPGIQHQLEMAQYRLNKLTDRIGDQ